MNIFPGETPGNNEIPPPGAAENPDQQLDRVADEVADAIEEGRDPTEEENRLLELFKKWDKELDDTEDIPPSGTA